MHKFVRSVAELYFIPRSSTLITYMLQATEYQPLTFLKWFWRTEDFARVMRRRTLDPTKAARLVRAGTFWGMLSQAVFGVACIVAEIHGHFVGGIWFGLALVLAYPVVWVHIVALVVCLGRIFVVGPREKQYAADAATRFQNHAGLRIAIAGSYGKTSMKELLATVLQEGKKVAATPANMNVISSHARFARSLQGDEEIVLVEFGEGKPGDVAKFADIVRPQYGVITGLAPAHLDAYKTLQAAGHDIFLLADVVPHDKLYVNVDSPETHAFLPEDGQVYSHTGALGWRVQKASTGLDGTSFDLVRGRRRLMLHSELVGLHHVGPLAFAAAFALSLGLSEKQVMAGILRTKPFEHRMQPYKLAGAWIVDDTYNGNLEGIKAGTQLLKSLKAARKVYVTPGLVDQGAETAVVHQQVGAYIAAAKPDVVVLMQNSALHSIQAGLIDAAYRGEVRIEEDPLIFYQNLDSFVAAGDVVLMQNDWTDNYR